MNEVTAKEKLVREIILKVFPESNGFGDKTLDDLARGATPDIKPNPNALSMNLAQAAQEIHGVVPAIKDLIELGVAGFTAWKAGAASNPPTAKEIADEVVRRFPNCGADEKFVNRASRASRFIVERQSQEFKL